MTMLEESRQTKCNAMPNDFVDCTNEEGEMEGRLLCWWMDRRLGEGSQFLNLAVGIVARNRGRGALSK